MRRAVLSLPQTQHAVWDRRGGLPPKSLSGPVPPREVAVKACADLIFREQPRVLEQFPPLRAMVMTLSAKRRNTPAEEEPAPGEVMPPSCTSCGASGWDASSGVSAE